MSPRTNNKQSNQRYQHMTYQHKTPPSSPVASRRIETPPGAPKRPYKHVTTPTSIKLITKNKWMTMLNQVELEMEMD